MTCNSGNFFRAFNEKVKHDGIKLAVSKQLDTWTMSFFLTEWKSIQNTSLDSAQVAPAKKPNDRNCILLNYFRKVSIRTIKTVRFRSRPTFLEGRRIKMAST
jgi:hypothetical protein